MRDFAENELQDKFDVRDFYDAVLLCGAVPLDVLDARVKEYVENNRDTGELPKLQRSPGPASSVQKPATRSMMEIMTFANWCKCCVVPGTCQE